MIAMYSRGDLIDCLREEYDLFHIKNITELNDLLASRCLKYTKHTIKGRSESVGEMFSYKKGLLHPLPGYRFETAKSTTVRVNAFSTIKFRTNNYSVPLHIQEEWLE